MVLRLLLWVVLRLLLWLLLWVVFWLVLLWLLLRLLWVLLLRLLLRVSQEIGWIDLLLRASRGLLLQALLPHFSLLLLLLLLQCSVHFGCMYTSG